MKKIYRYNDVLYFNEDDVNLAIVEEIGGKYNNFPPEETYEFEQIWADDVEELDEVSKWNTNT